MADLLTPVRTPRLITADQLIRRAIVLLAAEQPGMDEVRLFDLLMDKTCDAFTDLSSREPAPPSEAHQ